MTHRDSNPHIILLNPPVVKPSEPPAGVARLAGALHQAGLSCTVVDLNLEGLLSLTHNPCTASDRWTQRALRSFSKNLSTIRSPLWYGNFDRYQRTVMDLNRVFEKSSPTSEVHLNLTNYHDRQLSSTSSADLLRAAEAPERNPFFPYFYQRLVSLMATENATIVGISLNYLSQALSAFALLGLLRRTFPGLTLVLGGGLVTSWMRRPGWQNPFNGLVDHLVAGEGERALLTIAGISGADRQHFMPTFPSVAASSRTQHPAPASHDRPYLSPGFILPYSASTGCYWNRCAFCPERAEGTPYVPIPDEDVVSELQQLVRTTRPILLHLLDNALSPHLLQALAGNPPGVSWYGFARMTDHLADADFCLALRRAGCVMLQLGIESGDQGVLDHQRKGIDLTVVACALKHLRTAGIATYVCLLFGTPAETIQEARKTLAFTVRHAEEIGFLNLAIFNLPINGPEAQILKTRKHSDGDLSLYVDFDHPRGWHRAVVRQFLDKEFKRHPAVASIVRRDPPFFTSNHAPFFATGTVLPVP